MPSAISCERSIRSPLDLVTRRWLRQIFTMGCANQFVAWEANAKQVLPNLLTLENLSSIDFALKTPNPPLRKRREAAQAGTHPPTIVTRAFRRVEASSR